jgi:serine/threonine protein kinase
MLTGE